MLELHPLLLGWEVVPRGLSLDGAGGWERVPVPGWRVVHDDGVLLIDTGLTPDAPPGFDELYPRGRPERLPLATEGVTLVALPHLHIDHTGGLRDLPGVPAVVQRAELDAVSGIAEGYHPPDWASTDLRPVDGEVELVPGVTMVPTPGHTPGHASFVVELASGRVVLACDAIDLTEGLERDVTIGAAHPDDDPAARRASHDLLRSLGGRLVPGHCPRALPPLAGQRLR
jgi:N-acyl homoserine lactone hydrolase